MISGFTVLSGEKPQAALKIRITKQGIFINAAARRVMGNPSRVQFGLDEHGHRLAVCPVSLSENGIALSCGHTGNRVLAGQLLAVFGEGRSLEGRQVDGGIMFGSWEED